MKSCHLLQHGWTRGYHAKCNKSYRERKQITHDFTYMCNVNKTKQKQTYRYREQTCD